MTLTVAIEGYGSLDDCEDTTNWSCTTIAGPVQEGENYLEGSYGVSAKASNKAGELEFDVNTEITRDLDFDTAGTEEGELLFIWINVTTLGTLDSAINNGLSIRLYTSSGNYADWMIAHSTDISNFRAGKGGFVCFALDPTTTPTIETGTFDPGAVNQIHIHIDTTASAKVENLIVDHLVCGSGVRITGTDDGEGWKEVADYCTDHANRAWGMIQWDDDESTIYSMGKIILGSSSQSANTSLTDSDRTIKFIQTMYCSDNTTLTEYLPMVSDDFMGIELHDASATYTTTLQDGFIVGSDAGRNGSSFRGSSQVTTYFDASGLTLAGSSVKLYGTKFDGIDGYIDLENDADHQYFSCVFNNCGQVDAGANPDFRNCIFSNTRDVYSETESITDCQHYDDSTTTYTDETTDINDSGTSDVLVPNANLDLLYFGQDYQFFAININVGAVQGSPGTIDWEYYNGSSWVALSNVVDWTVGFHKLGTALVRWAMPSDWATTTVNGVGPYYYIRAKCTANPGGSPALTQAWIYKPGSSFLWYTGGDLNIQDCLFINNPHGIQQTVAEEVDYNDLVFSGNTYDIHFTAASGDLTVNNVGDSNASTGEVEGTGSITYVTPVTFKLIDLISNSEVRLIKKSDNSEIDGVENSGTTFQYNYNWVGDIDIWVTVLHMDYEYIRFGATLTNSDQTIPVFQSTDRNYSNP